MLQPTSRTVRWRLAAALTLVIFLTPSFATAEDIKPHAVKWSELPSLPDAHGFAGTFAGVSGEALIVAGGANFPEKPPWEGGSKVWHDKIYILDKPDGAWRIGAQRLPHGWAYGISATVVNEAIESSDHRALLCVGGDDGERCLKDVALLTFKDGKIEQKILAPLPRPVSQACGAVVGKTFYIAGGIDRLDATRASNSVFAMDVSGPPESWFWRGVLSWRGPARMQAVAGSMGGKFYLFGGVELDAKVPKHHRVTPYLRDCYCFTPGENDVAGTWQRLADLPRPIAAAPSPAGRVGTSTLVIAGGVDGAMVDHDQATHLGFTLKFTAYDTEQNKWSELAKLPSDSSRVTAPTTEWRGGWIVVSGESRPGVRSPQMYIARPRPH